MDLISSKIFFPELKMLILLLKNVFFLFYYVNLSHEIEIPFLLSIYNLRRYTLNEISNQTIMNDYVLVK